MLHPGTKSVKRLVIPAVLCLFATGILYYFFINGGNKGAPSSVSPKAELSEGNNPKETVLTPNRNDSLSSPDSANNEDILKKNQQKFQGLKKYTTFNTANTKPFFKVGPGSVKKLSTEKPEQSNPFITGVEPSSSERLPTITVDDESVPAIFFSSPNPNDCESQSNLDSLPEIDLLNGKLIVSPGISPDSASVISPK
jgi:hypothetical protein